MPGFPSPREDAQDPRKQLPALPVTRLDERTGIADLDSPHAVSLTIGQPLPIKNVLLLLVRGTAFSLVVDEAVDGSFSGELKDLTLRQALDAVLTPQGLAYTADGNLLTVHRPKPSTRFFDVSYLNIRREWRRGISGGSSLPGQPASVDFSASTGGSYFDEVDRGVAALLSSRGRAHVDRRSGLVQVTDFEERLDRVATYLETMHTRAVRQVRLSARVLEVALGDEGAQAIDWKAVAERSGQPWDASGRGAGVLVNDFSAVVSALGEQGRVRTLASPQVLAMNNEPAIMRVGTRDVYFTTATAAADDRRSMPSAMMHGLTMTITPHIDAGGMVQLSVSPTYTQKTGDSRSRQGDSVPVVSVAEADTLVRIRDGESILLTGLLQERTTTAPSHGLAGVFGAQRKETVRTELVILLHASIVTPGAPPTTGAR